MEKLVINDYLRYVINKIYIIVIFVIFFGVVGFVYVYVNNDKTFTSESRFICIAKNYDDTKLDNFVDVALSEKVLTDVSKTMNEKYSVSYLKSVINVSNTRNSDLIIFQASTNSAQLSNSIVVLLEKSSITYFNEIYESSGFKCTKLQESSVAKVSDPGKSISKHVILGAFVGLALGLTYLFIKFDN